MARRKKRKADAFDKLGGAATGLVKVGIPIGVTGGIIAGSGVAGQLAPLSGSLPTIASGAGLATTVVSGAAVLGEVKKLKRKRKKR